MEAVEFWKFYHRSLHMWIWLTQTRFHRNIHPEHKQITSCSAGGFGAGVIRTLDVCHTWWGGIHRLAASLTVARRWAVSGLPAVRWRTTESNTSSRPSPSCERSPPAPPFLDSPAFCRGICSNKKKTQKKTAVRKKGGTVSKTSGCWNLLPNGLEIIIEALSLFLSLCTICPACVFKQQQVMETATHTQKKTCSNLPYMFKKLLSCVWRFVPSFQQFQCKTLVTMCCGNHRNAHKQMTDVPSWTPASHPLINKHTTYYCASCIDSTWLNTSCLTLSIIGSI